jgi:ectoine hydroxylase-related dioxygenase (phytanoyl-CoA dioxygenase family)
MADIKPPRGSRDLRKNRSTEKDAAPKLSNFAVFGDSVWALVLSSLLLLVAVATSLWIDHSAAGDGDGIVDLYTQLGPVPVIDPPQIFDILQLDAITDEILSAYKKDGVVAVRGLIEPEVMDRLDAEANVFLEEQRRKNDGHKRPGTQFHTVHHNAIFRHPPDNTTISPWVEVTLRSRVPQFAAELLGMRQLDSNQTMRMLRDIFLAKDDDQYTCGWHVDDFGFWPATAESPGVNAWVALDDMPVDQGGGFALAIASHQAPWREEAHYVTGASTTFPAQGYTSADDMIANRPGKGTCNLKYSAPHLHKRMEETKRIYPVKRGDVIFHERWLFHRTVPFDRAFVAEHQNEDVIYRRYSIRYGPGSSVIPPGYGTELSVLSDERNGGRTADEVTRFDGPWYPQAWPSASDNELRDLRQLVENRVPTADLRRTTLKKEMKPLLKRLARKQNKPLI